MGGEWEAAIESMRQTCIFDGDKGVYYPRGILHEDEGSNARLTCHSTAAIATPTESGVIHEKSMSLLFAAYSRLLWSHK